MNSGCGRIGAGGRACGASRSAHQGCAAERKCMERATRFELATLSLEG